MCFEYISATWFSHCDARGDVCHGTYGILDFGWPYRTERHHNQLWNLVPTTGNLWQYFHTQEFNGVINYFDNVAWVCQLQCSSKGLHRSWFRTLQHEGGHTNTWSRFNGNLSIYECSLCHELYVLIAPSAAPQGLRTVVKSSTSIMVYWGDILEKDRNGEIILYEVKYGMGSNPMLLQNTTQNSLLSLTLTSLNKSMQYNIHVHGYTSEGPGPFSNPVMETTLEDRMFELCHCKICLLALIFLVKTHFNSF